MTAVGLADTDAPRPLQVLVVCTGNLCRSPLFAGLLDRAARGGEIVVVSRGTQVGGAAAVPAATLAAARRRGIDLADHRSEQLTAEDVAQADLVLTATRSHRQEVVRLVPRAARATFTVNEFARVVADLAPAGPDAGVAEGRARPRPGGAAALLRARLDDAAALRGVARRPARPSDDDVLDPMGRRRAAHERAARQLEAAAARVAAFLGGSVVPDPVPATAPGRRRERTRQLA